MRIFGFQIVRLKGVKVGSYESAIIDLQERVDTLEKHRKVKVKEVEHETAEQTEIDKILSQGAPVNPGDLWSRL
ncbi:hypothetical protein ES705_36374 [subsurface metagenome]